MNERVEKRLNDVPAKYKKLYSRCVDGTVSPRRAIKMQCLECWGWQRMETAQCDNICCPLFAYRPYQNPSSPRVSETDNAGHAETIQG